MVYCGGLELRVSDVVLGVISVGLTDSVLIIVVLLLEWSFGVCCLVVFRFFVAMPHHVKAPPCQDACQDARNLFQAGIYDGASSITRGQEVNLLLSTSRSQRS